MKTRNQIKSTLVDFTVLWQECQKQPCRRFSLKSSLHKKWSFLLRISSVTVTKSAGNVVFVTFTEESLNENFTFCAVAVFKKFTIPTGNTCVGVSFKNNAGLKTWNYIKKRPKTFSMVHCYASLKVQGLDCMTTSGFRVWFTGLVFCF